MRAGQVNAAMLSYDQSSASNDGWQKMRRAILQPEMQLPRRVRTYCDDESQSCEWRSQQDSNLQPTE
jgi:hypothetical protein